MIDESDVSLAQAGDKDAFSRLIYDCQNAMYRVAKSILKQDEDCADAIQEAITKSYYSINKLKNQQNFKTWLIRILINQCYDLLKQKKKDIPTEPSDPLFQLNAQQETNEYYQLSEAITKLSTNNRIIITLFYYEQLTLKEIANILKIKEGTVKSRLNRARNKLATYLTKNKFNGRVENGSE